MATVQEPPRIANRHESFVDSEIARASRRIRAHDVGAASLGLVLGTLVFALTMVLLDRAFDLSVLFRQFALIGYLVAAGLFAATVLSRPFRRQVNPYYAARQVERAVPAAKNSVVNWLDLRDQPLPQTIKAALGARAASDLTKADFDEVLHDRRIGWLGGVAAGLAFVALLLLFILRPTQFLSLVSRTFAPFGSPAAIAKQTELTLVQPSTGNVTVPVNQSVEFRVLVEGRNPDPAADDAVRLQMRYNPADTVWEDRRLEPGARDPREYSVRVPAIAVQNGFTYQIVGGDATTPEYRVTVRSSPLIDSFEVLYHFRPYLRFADQLATNPNLESLRGTQVTMTVKTNRHVKDGWLRFDKSDGQSEQPSIAGELVADQPNALRFRFTLERDGNYRVHFKSLEGDENQDPIPYTIKVLSDHAPQVEITRAAPEGLAINGIFSLEGKASDDFGLTKLRLCSRLFENDKDPKPLSLIDKPFRDGKPLRFDDGTYPRALDYKEAVPLEQLRIRGGVTPALKAGMIIEYWLEAEDNCDYPQPNVGKSKIYRVTLGEPKAEDEKKSSNEQAKAEKQDFDAKQDQDLKNENDAKKSAADNQPPNSPPQPPANEPKPENANPDAAKPPDNPPNERDNPPMDPQRKAEEDSANELAKKLEEKLNEKNNEAAQPKAESKPDQQPNDRKAPPPEGAPKGEPKPDQQQPNQPTAGPKGAAKPDNTQPGMGDKGEAKSEGQPEQPPQPGEAKPQCVDPNKPDQPDGVPMPSPNPKNSGSAPGAKPDQPNSDSGQPKKPDAGKSDQNNKNSATPPKPDANNTGTGNQDQTKPDAGQPPKPEAKNPGAENKDQAKPNANQPQKPNANNPGASNKDQAKPDAGQPPKPDANNQGAGNKDQTKPDAGQPPKPDANNQGAVNKDQAKPDAGQPPKPDANNQGAGNKDQTKPDAGQPPKPDANNPGAGNQDKTNSEQNKGGGQPSPGESKPAPKPDAGANPGEAKAPPKEGTQPGENKDGQSTSDANKQNPKPDSSSTPKSEGQPGTQPGATKTSSPPGKQDPNKPDAKNQSQPQKNDQGGGGEGGTSQSQGEATKTGPKNNPTQNTPKANPDASDPGKKGPEGTTPSGQPDQGAPPENAEVRKGEGKGQGKPEPAPAKGEAKPDAARGGTPGSSDEKGTLENAPKGSSAGPKPKSEPTTEGTPGGTAEKKDSGDKHKMTPDEMVKKAADLAKKLAENAKDLKDAAPKDEKTRAELEKKMAEAKDNEKELADALRNADPKLKKELADNLEQLRQELAKQEAGQPKAGEPKPSDLVNDLAKELGKPSDQEARKSDGPPNSQPNPMGKPSDKGPTKPDESNPTGGDRGNGMNVKSRPIGDAPRLPTGDMAGDHPDAKHAAKAGEMLLEEFKKKVDRKLLDEMKMTEAEYAEFLRAYGEMVKRQKAAADKNDRQRGASIGGSAANSGAKRIQAGKEKPSNLERGGAALAPPDMRDGYKGFTEDVSKTGSKPKDK